MSKITIYLRRFGLIACFFVFLSGCTSAPTVTFEEMAKWQDGIFISEFGGFSVEIPAGWSSLSDNEIAAQVEGMENVIYGTPSVDDKQFQTTDGLYPLILVTEVDSDSETPAFASAFVIFERLGAVAQMTVKTEDKYLEILKQGYLEEDANGIRYRFGDFYSKTIGGIEYRCLPITIEAYQVQQLFAVRLKDDFAIGLIFTVTADHSELIEEAYGAFSLLP